MRSIRYALERYRLVMELKENWQREREQLERELHMLEQLHSRYPTMDSTPVSDAALLMKSTPAAFGDLARQFSDLLDKALEQRAYKVEYDLSENIRYMAEQMGFLKGGARDVIKLYTTVMQKKISNSPPAKASAYVEEGRFMLLKLMGYLTSFYRGYSLDVAKASSPETKRVEKNERR